MQGWSEGQVTARRDWAEGLVSLTLAAEVERFDPGQFVNLALEREGELERRSYSIASPPGEPLEFLVAEVQGGLLTPHLTALALEQRVFVERKPQGFFTLKWVPDARDLWLVATGTGLGPFMSILRSPEVWTRFERVVLVHGARDAAHFAYRDTIVGLCAAHGDKLKAVWVQSRETPAGSELAGRVTGAFADGRLERAADTALSPTDSHVMLCGNPQMIEEMTTLLGARGLRRHRVRTPGHITIEKYW